MKKFNLFALSIFAVALWSCTDKNDLGGNVPDGDVVTNYLSVSIVPTMETGTRAIEGEEPAGDNGDYVYGSDVENYVKNVRIFFFDAEGKAQDVKRDALNNRWLSYFDFETPVEDGTIKDSEKPNVERVIKAQLVIESPNDDKVPASLVAIVNYDKTLFNNQDIDASTIEKLLANTGKYAKQSYGDEEGILMSSSVYMKDNGSKVVEVKLTPENFYDDPDVAKLNPVTIYVERAVAKVSLDVATTSGAIDAVSGDTEAAGGKYFKLSETKSDGKSGAITINGKDVYVKFLGWNVTQTANKSFAVKNLDDAWATTAPFAGWTYPTYFRSYWAKNPSDITLEYTNFNVANADLPAGSAVKGILDDEAENTPNYTYVHENAPQDDVDDKPTEVLVAARLVTENGETIGLAEFNGFRFMTVEGSGDLDYHSELLKAVANMIGVWKKTVTVTKENPGDPDSKDITTITYEGIQNELELVSANDLKEYDKNGKGTYFTYVQLKESVLQDLKDGKYTFVDNNDQNGKIVGTTEEITEPSEEQSFNALNAKLRALPKIKVWEGGNTYYYVDIAHLNTRTPESPAGFRVGEYGVVRNHWYAINVKEVIGLGTPVFDPNEEIIPEKPEDFVSYLAAEIKILSWRLVNQNATLGK